VTTPGFFSLDLGFSEIVWVFGFFYGNLGFFHLTALDFFKMGNDLNRDDGD